MPSYRNFFFRIKMTKIKAQNFVDFPIICETRFEEVSGGGQCDQMAL